jgi:hypothetical protein
VIVNLPGGVGFDNHGGFAAASGGLPATVPGLERYAGVLHALAVPHWFAAALAGAAPLAWLRRWVAARRRPRAGLCVRCGYDLRATPDGCPECGSGREAGVGRMSAVP